MIVRADLERADLQAAPAQGRENAQRERGLAGARGRGGDDERRRAHGAASGAGLLVESGHDPGVPHAQRSMRPPARGQCRMTGGTAPLRRGWTTGACATAAVKAAFGALVGPGLRRSGDHPPAARRLAPASPWPSGSWQPGCATAAIVKDAGDDPDVTHGCLVRATVRWNPAGAGITFHAGEGVGTVTRAGLPIPPGEPAINPVPRQMMRQVVEEIADEARGRPDVAITIAIPGGEALAAKTLNRRLGIVGGLSILGTTGVVVPYSCAAWIHSIHRGIDVARAAGLAHVAAATGSTSEQAVRAALRPGRDGAARHGRFRRRDAEISAPASDPAPVARRRLRQARQAGAGPSRPALGALATRPAVAGRVCCRARRFRSRWRPRSPGPTRRARASPWRPTPASLWPIWWRRGRLRSAASWSARRSRWR